MNREDIIRMARQAGSLIEAAQEKDLLWLGRFAALVSSAEREHILDICKEGLWDAEGIRYHLENQDRGQA